MPTCTMSWRTCLMALAGALALLLLTAPASADTSATPTMPACASGPRWIVNAGSLDRSRTTFPLAEQRRVFDSPCTFLVGGMHTNSDYRDWHAVATGSITHLDGLDEMARNNAIAAVLYDPEAWPMTPHGEQLDPAAATCKAEALAHAHGKLLIATPAINLIRFVDPSDEHTRRYPAFVQTGLAGRIARCADVYEIQAQGAEADTAKFRDFVLTEARQARAANPRVIVLAGISTNPSGQHVTAEQVYNAVQSVRDSVDGYWLNIPAEGKYCPRCGEPQPQVAVQLLQLMHAAETSDTTP